MAEYLYREKYLKNKDFGQSFRIFLSINWIQKWITFETNLFLGHIQKVYPGPREKGLELPDFTKKEEYPAEDSSTPSAKPREQETKVSPYQNKQALNKPIRNRYYVDPQWIEMNDEALIILRDLIDSSK